jgi:hypothetical protein
LRILTGTFNCRSRELIVVAEHSAKRLAYLNGERREKYLADHVLLLVIALVVISVWWSNRILSFEL